MPPPIDLCLSVFPWAHFRSTKAAIRVHTLLDLRGSIPSFIHISDGTLHEVNVLDLLIPEAGAFYVMDRGYTDFARLNALHQAGAFFVIQAKSNLDARRLYSAPTERETGVLCDQTIALNGFYSGHGYPEHLRRIGFKDETGKRLVFLTNHFRLPALIVCALYRQRWQVELFFKWIKQASANPAFLRHLRERGEDTALDRGLGVSARGHHQETAPSRGLASYASTNPVGDRLREDHVGTSTYAADVQPGTGPIRQPNEFIRNASPVDSAV